eukprot:5686369-Pleurochrysis_carterae.AAC.1
MSVPEAVSADARTAHAHDLTSEITQQHLRLNAEALFTAPLSRHAQAWPSCVHANEALSTPGCLSCGS